MDLLLPEFAQWFLIFVAITAIIFLGALLHLLLVNKSRPSNDKILWVLIILFVPVLGPILYFIAGRQRAAAG